jgi:hypothetical protein
MKAKTTTNENVSQRLDELQKEIELLTQLTSYDRAFKDDYAIRSLFLDRVPQRKVSRFKAPPWIFLATGGAIVLVVCYLW